MRGNRHSVDRAVIFTANYPNSFHMPYVRQYLNLIHMQTRFNFAVATSEIPTLRVVRYVIVILFNSGSHVLG
jgi:hypothetical protein